MSAHAAEPIDGMYRHYSKPETITIREVITMSKALNLKNMKETIINYSADQTDFDKIWDAFYQMACVGFISQDTWRKFFDQCRGWHVDEEHMCIRDEQRCVSGIDSVVWKYTPDAEYKA